MSGRRFSRSDGTDRAGNAIRDLPGGNYQWRVEGSTGAYGFRLIDVAAAIPFTPGSALVSGVLEPGRSTDIFSFAGEAGQKLYFDARTTLNSGERKSVVEGMRVSVRVDHGGRRIIKNKTKDIKCKKVTQKH